MPYKDPEQRKEANRLRMQKRRAEGAWLDPAKEAERKARWYAEQGGKEKRLEADRRRLSARKAEKISKIHEH